MKVGINATSLNDRPSGAKQRFIGIYSELFNQMEGTEFIIYGPTDCQVGNWFKGHQNVNSKSTPIPSVGRVSKFLKGLTYWSNELAKNNFQIFEALHLPLVRPTSGKTLLTIHDIRGIYRENPLFQRQLFKYTLRDALIRSDHIVTVSNSMRDEIESFYPNSRTSVVYNGIDLEKYRSISEDEVNDFKTRYGLPNSFIFSVGHFEKRKNFGTLIDAVHLLRQRGIDIPLVIIGNDSGEKQLLTSKINSMGLADSVTLLTGISDLEVSCAFKECSLFVFPSKYEGFGIPILEAMAAGKPTVLSTLPVFREITEDQMVYVHPDSFIEMADAIEMVLTSSEVNQRLTEYGQNRVKDFSFQHLARSMAKVYRDLT